MKKQILIIFLGLVILNNNPLKGQVDSVNYQLKMKQDSLIAMEKLAKEQKVKLNLLKTIGEMNGIKIKEQKEVQKKQNLIIYAGLFLLLLGFIILNVLYIKNKVLKKRLRSIS